LKYIKEEINITVIKDGVGSGSIAEVNSINQLSTISMTQSDAAVGSDLGVCWIVDGQVVMTSGVERTVMIITNSGTTQVEIGLTVTSVQNNPQNSGLTTIIKTYIGTASAVTGTSGGVTKTPVNMNTKYTTLPNVGVATNSPVITGADTEVTQYYFQMQDTQMIDWQSSIVLSQGGSYRVTATGAAGTASGLVNHNVRFVNEFH
jgi:hypothetical protein